jgi:hypothetical protein
MLLNYSPQSLARRWQVSSVTIRKMCDNGTLEHHRIGEPGQYRVREYRIRQDVVEQFERGGPAPH